MAGFQKFEAAMADLLAEIRVATGEDPLTGSQVGQARFDGFLLTSDISARVRLAINHVEQDHENDAVNELTEALRHLRNKQGAFLRGHILSQLSKRMINMQKDHFGNDLINPIYTAIAQLEEYCSGPINLDKAAEMLRDIITMIQTAEVTHEQRVVEQQRSFVAAEQVRQQRCHRAAEELRRRYAALVA